MKEFLKKEPVKRAIRTFIQAAAGYIAVNLGEFKFMLIKIIFNFYIINKLFIIYEKKKFKNK